MTKETERRLAQLQMNSLIKLTFRQARRVVVFTVGSAVLVTAAVLIAVPGPPGWPLLPLGLGILATEFVWARRQLTRIKDGAGGVAKRLSSQSASGR